MSTQAFTKNGFYGFSTVNFPWLSGNVPRLPSYGIYILHLVRFARYCISVSYFHYRNLQITSKLLTYTYFTSSRNVLEIFQVILGTSIQIWYYIVNKYVSKGITHLVFYGDLLMKLRIFKDTTKIYLVELQNRKTTLTSTVWPCDHREDDRSRAWSIIWCSYWFCIPSLSRQCIATFAVAERRLLLDIGWFVLFFYNPLQTVPEALYSH